VTVEADADTMRIAHHDGCVGSNRRTLSSDDHRRALNLIAKLRRPSTPEEAVDPLMVELERLVKCPHVADLMFWAKPELSDDEVLNRALEYQPFVLRRPSGEGNRSTAADTAARPSNSDPDRS
jgi:hypothetical protein